MKKRLLAGLLTLSMLLTVMSSAALASDANQFSDVKTADWFYDEVLWVNNEGLMNGISDTAFAPNDNTTRGMIVTILWRMEGSPAATGTQFNDVAAGQYYTSAVLWASNNEVVNGYGDGNFGPNDSITREQLAAILYRYADYSDSDVSGKADLSKFADADSISDYAINAFAWANANGLITGMGDGTLAPQGNATRAQVAAILYRMVTGDKGTSSKPGDNDNKATYTVKFEYNYSDKGTYKTVSVTEGETVSRPANPTVSGYSFGGWYTKAENGEKFDFSTAINSDITLYAQWNKYSGGGGGSSHSHNYTGWTSNGDGTHTGKCSCGKTSTESCTFEATTLPEKNNDGKYTYTCTVCGEFESEDLMIYNADQLKAFAADVNAGNSYSGQTVLLINDIDLDGTEWTPIGISGAAFRGTFDGQDYTISDLTVKGTECVGLFGSVIGHIKNVNVSGGTVTGNHYVGGIAGYVYGKITDCSVEGLTVTATPNAVDEGYDNGDKVGGIVGYICAEPTGEASGNTVKDVIVNAYRDAGGVAGMANGEKAVVSNNTVENVTVNVDQTADENYGYKTPNAGAIVGRNGKATVTANTESDVTVNIKLAPITDGDEDKVVVADVNGKAYTSLEEAVENTTEGSTLTIFAGEYELPTDLKSNMTIVGNGDVTITNAPNVTVSNLTVRGIDFKNENATSFTIKGSGTFEDCSFVGQNGIYNSVSIGDFVFTDCTMEGTMYGINFGYGPGNVTIKNCNITGWNSFGVTGTVTISDTVFADNDFVSGNGLLCNHLRMYQNATITNCTFNPNLTIDVVDGKTASFSECTVDDGSNLVDLFDWEIINEEESVIIIDGIQVLADGFGIDEEGCYVISNVAGMKYFAESVNNGETYAGKTVKLEDNIDLNNEAWTPIGLNADDANKFCGTFDGNGKTISNLKVETEEGYTAAGLFGALNGTATNFTIDGAVIKHISTGNADGNTDNGIAVVAGSVYTSGTVKGVTVKNATVEGNRYMGGISGYTYGNVIDCTVENITLTATPNEIEENTYDNGDKVGSVVGYFASESTYEVSGNHASNVTIKGYRDLGGIVGAGDGCGKVTENSVENITITVDQKTNFYKDKDANAGIIVGRVISGSVDDSNVATNATIIISDSNSLVNTIANAQSGVNTVIELAEGTYSVPQIKIDSNKDITIVPAEGAKVTFDGQFFVTGKLTVKDITITNENATSEGISKAANNAIYVQSEGKVNCEGVTFEIKKATAITSWWGLGDWTDIVVKDCTFNCNGNRPLQSEGPITIEGCTFNNPYRYAVQLTASDAEINFKNNTINKTEDNEKPVYAVQLTCDYGNSNLVINGEGNKINRTAGNYEDALYVWEPGTGVSNGYVDIKTIELNATDGELKALIDDELYTTEDGGIPVTNVEEFEEIVGKGATVVIPEGKEITLDLTNETITNTVLNSAAIKNNGTLTITGGTYLNENYSTFGSHVIVNNEGATLTIDNGTFGSDNNSGNAVLNKGGTVVINNGTFASSDRDEHPDVWAYVFNCIGGTMTINDANVECKANGMFAAASGGIITVNGGNYELLGGKNNYYMCYAPDGTINLNGGSYTFNGSNNCIWPVYVGSNGSVNISEKCELIGKYWENYKPAQD